MRINLHLMRKYEIRENLIYLGLWLILFLSPVLSAYIRTTADSTLTFQWSDVFPVWRLFLVYLLVFVVHNFLVAPLLVHRKKKLYYMATVVCLLAAFLAYQCGSRPPEAHFRDGGPMGGPPEMRGERPMMADEGPMAHEGDFAPPADFDDVVDIDLPGDSSEMRARPHESAPRMMDKRPPMFFGQHDIVAFIILFLMLGMNVGVKFYFKSNHDSKTLEELRNRSMEQQLEYLKYQINPHFFMNTLNNIHALVDIDPEKAKDTILELSKLMRYVLYEGSKATVPLQREVAFLNNYITLMKIRYTSKVDIRVEMPERLPDKEVPPLLFITFVENAFKHGVSYQKESFIHVSMQVDGDRVMFGCRNSKIESTEDEHGGVGLANVRKRLELLYENDYTLDIADEADAYGVRLEVPLI